MPDNSPPSPNPQAFFQRIIRLENDRAVLVPLSLSHVEALADMAYEQDLWQFTRSRIVDEDDLHIYVDDAIAERRAARQYPFAVLDAKTGQLAGCTRFCRFSWPDRRVEIGYTWYGKAFRGSGINAGAKHALLQLAFDELGMERVEFRTDARNQLSRRALANIGAVEEGILRSHLVNWDGYRRDTVYTSILRHEWPGLQQGVFAGIQAIKSL